MGSLFFKKPKVDRSGWTAADSAAYTQNEAPPDVDAPDPSGTPSPAASERAGSDREESPSPPPKKRKSRQVEVIVPVRRFASEDIVDLTRVERQVPKNAVASTSNAPLPVEPSAQHGAPSTPARAQPRLPPPAAPSVPPVRAGSIPPSREPIAGASTSGAAPQAGSSAAGGLAAKSRFGRPIPRMTAGTHAAYVAKELKTNPAYREREQKKAEQLREAKMRRELRRDVRGRRPARARPRFRRRSLSSRARR